MSIDARVTGVQYHDDGTATLFLEPREPGGFAGQERLTVLDAPRGLEGLEGVCVWGGAGSIIFQGTKLADRIGYVRIRFTGSAHVGDRVVGL